MKETPKHTEEEVGAFTKLIEAMGFTGPLKYNKWVSGGGKGEVNVEEKYEECRSGRVERQSEKEAIVNEEANEK